MYIHIYILKKITYLVYSFFSAGLTVGSKLALTIFSNVLAFFSLYILVSVSFVSVTGLGFTTTLDNFLPEEDDAARTVNGLNSLASAGVNLYKNK